MSDHIASYVDGYTAGPRGKVSAGGTRVPNNGPFAYLQATLEEAIGPGPDLCDIADDVMLLAADIHSDQSDYGYALAPLVHTGSFERWVRLRFDAPVNTVTGIRFWIPNTIPIGWTIRCGSTGTYQSPTQAVSSVALAQVPTLDPGRLAPNIGSGRLIGTGTQYSDWLVIQATVDTAVAHPGPILGFSSEATLIPLSMCFSWIET